MKTSLETLLLREAQPRTMARSDENSTRSVKTSFGEELAEASVAPAASKAPEPVTQPFAAAAPAAEKNSAPAPKSAAAEQPPTRAVENALTDPLEILKEGLRKAGVNPDGLNLTVSRTNVVSPGGNWVNHSIDAKFGDVAQSYDIGLMLRNPRVTVVEILQRLGINA